MQNSDTSSMPWLASYPEQVDWFKTYTGTPVWNILDQATDKYKNNVCTDFFGAELTYEDIRHGVNHAAALLSSLGADVGTHVALLFPNTPAYIVYYFAALRTGCTIVNCNPLYSDAELEAQIEDSKASILVTHDLALTTPKAEKLLDKKRIEHLVVVSFAALLPPAKSILFRLFKRSTLKIPDRTGREERLHYITRLDTSPAPDITPPDIDPDKALAVLQYTGGTTGLPKGAMLSHSNLTINVQQVLDWTEQVVNDGKESVIGILPFFHVFGMTAVMNVGIATGAKLILIPKFELREALQLISTKKPTTLPGVPTLFNAMIHCPEINQYDLSSIKFGISGGAPLPLEVRKQFEKLAGCTLVEAYGLSETSPLVTSNPVSDLVRDSSIGLPVPATHITFRSLDDPSQSVPLGEKGELCIRGPQVMSGYWGRDNEKDNVFVDGYFRTGDVGYMDPEDGFIYIVDRLKDMIIASGFKIYPRQIEDVLYEHPAIEEAVIIGIPDEYRGETPKAFIKLKKDQQASEEDILDFLSTRIAKHEMPSKIEFRTELPKTIIGKLSRKELRENI